ncbi:MAG: PSD1 and planctomycete cytochrome C domain-containing protein, partial [Isosphaeraceae bacterium]
MRVALPRVGGGVALALALALSATVRTSRAETPVDFSRDVRPILSRSCFACHGTDEATREAGLRLDLRDDAIAELKSGARAIVPGNPEESDLIFRITESDETIRMPPPKHGEPLSAQEIGVLTRWIAEGANYARHWAFDPPVDRPLPKVTRKNWPRNGVDYWVLARLESAGLKPAPEADRHTLLRRASLDLRGLPPTPEEIDAFTADTDPDAYEKAVDRFLADSAYGERWARLWLDLARYADSAGYGSDPLRTIWRYRDWVIDAFNKNLPYDQFTVEQIAGDLLPNPTLEQRMATAFHRNTMTNTEGGTDDEEFRVAAIKDRVDSTWQVWMGLTMGCAKCHTHKYDPITQEEYYRFFAVFNQTADSDKPDESPVITAPSPELSAELRRIDAELSKLKAKLNEVSPGLAETQKRWESARGGALTWWPLGTVERRQGAKSVKGPLIVPGVRLGTSPFALTLRLSPSATNGNVWDLSASPDPRAALRAGLPAAVADALDVPARRRNDAQKETIAAHVRSLDPALKPLLDEIAALEKSRPTPPTLPIMEELPPDKRRETFLLVKGNYLNPGAKVTPGVPGSLHELSAPPGQPVDRMAVARWLVDPANPLTARVAVNRYWAQLFGSGIVETEEDFGTQGDPPSHPELLDWLARRYVALGWNTKALLRTLVTSATYRQSSHVTPEALEKDPRNRLLTRGPRFRLEAEMVRDQALAISGLLSRKVGGPSVFPPQPEGLWQAAV